MYAFRVVLVLAFCFGRGYAYPSGAPSFVCTSLRPGSPHGTNTQSGNGGYIISVPSSLPKSTGTGFDYQAGVTYTIRIEKSDTSTPDFIGFALQAVTPGTTNLLGEFEAPGGSRQYMQCGNNMQAVTHNSAVDRTSEEFSWTAPSNQDGQVDFRYTIVRTRPVYFFALVASDTNNYEVRQPPTTTSTSMETTSVKTTFMETTAMSTTSMKTTSMETTAMPTTSMETTSMETNSMETTAMPTTPMETTSMETTSMETTPVKTSNTPVTDVIIRADTADGEMTAITQPTSGPKTKFAPISKTAAQVEVILKDRKSSKGDEVVVREPSDCERTQCKTYVSIRTWPGSPGILDIYLEGGAASWVAVGFTATPNMLSADVIACLRYPPTEGILVLDTWNNADFTFNEPDDNQQDVAINFGQYQDGRISCRINRTIAGSGSTKDLDLDNDYYLLYGVRYTAYTPSLSSPSLMSHEVGAGNIPNITAEKQNVVKLTEVMDDSSAMLDKYSVVVLTIFLMIALVLFM